MLIFGFLFFFLVFLVLLLKLCFRLTDFKYKFSGRIFPEAERSFFLVLKQSLAHEYEIFVKVRIADILAPDHPLNRRMQNSAFFKTSSKHFDYVLCDKETLTVLAVIELDDKSHNLSRTRRRDAFVEKACETAGLKLLRFPCKANYPIKALREKVMNSLIP